jgi:Zn-finger protein
MRRAAATVWWRRSSPTHIGMSDDTDRAYRESHMATRLANQRFRFDVDACDVPVSPCLDYRTTKTVIVTKSSLVATCRTNRFVHADKETET